MTVTALLPQILELVKRQDEQIGHQDQLLVSLRQQLESMLQPVDTKYPVENLKEIAKVVSTVPEGVKFLRKAERILQGRNKMVFETNQLDWGMAETLAYGTLLEEGFDVRISGQDVERGTFSHRHAILRDEISEQRINLLNTNP